MSAIIAQLSFILSGEKADSINSMNPNAGYITYKDALKPSFNGSMPINNINMPVSTMILLLISTFPHSYALSIIPNKRFANRSTKQLKMKQLKMIILFISV